VKQLFTLEDIDKAMRDRRAVVCPKSHAAFKGPTPAAVIINQQGGVILRLLRLGLFIYKKKEKKPFTIIQKED